MGASVENEARHICLSSLSPKSLREILQSSDLMKTAVVISSKSFTTQESLRLAEVIRSNFESAGIDWSSNFFAVTANVEAAIKWGFRPDHVLDMTHTVGGRYSVASPIGFSFALAYGLGAFESFRSGMRQVDEAVAKDPLESAPFAHALIWFWYRVFFNLQAVAVIPYVPEWRPLAGYLQQLLMESLGKSFDSEGQPLTIPAGSVVLGEVGTNSQHSFMQFLQCSTTAIPVDFLASLNFTEGEDFADFQLANAFAQSQALLFGTGEGASETTAPGGRPSNLLLTVDDSLHSLGQIVSFYEHSTVFQAGLYGINPFDQWGVEEGKKIARELLGRVPTSTLQVALEFFGDGVSGRFRS
jgi:glucose-6-phosphate isomerase